MSTRQANYTPAHVPAGPYQRDPVEDQQVIESRKLILAAAAQTKHDSVAILGAGHCTELPLVELLDQYKHVTINDVDAAELEKGLLAAPLTDEARRRIDVHLCDLTGATDPLLAKIEAALDAIQNPAAQIGQDQPVDTRANEAGDRVDAAIEAAAHVVDEFPLPGMPIVGRFDLIVASCVLSQLHFGLLHRAADVFERRFPGEIERLRQSVRWTSALYDLARRMEKRFLDDLVDRLAPGGLIYLSDSTQMCYVKRLADGRWETDGTYRLLRSQYLTDYLDNRFVVKASGRWDWVVNSPQATGDVGRLFDVQAVVLRTWRT